MPLWIITFFLGVCSITLFKKLPSLYWLYFLVFPIFIYSSFLRKFFETKCFRFGKDGNLFRYYSCLKNRLDKWSKVFSHFIIFFCGFFWSLIYVHATLAWNLPENLEGKNLSIMGYVADIPIKKFGRTSFIFKTETISGKREKVKLKLNWYGTHEHIDLGDKWKLEVRLKKPHGTLNPGCFDIEKSFLVKKIRATGYVVDGKRVKCNSSYASISYFRKIIIDKIYSTIGDKKLAPIINAFVTGDETKITTKQWQVLRNTGTNYLVAISGLHIGLIASLIFILVKFIWGFSTRLTLWIPGRDVGVVLGLIAGVIYSGIAGFSVPTQRALVMLFIFSFVMLFRRYSQSWNGWLWSLFIVLIINPLSILTAGFWLSFLAVASIIYVSSNRLKQSSSKIKNFFKIQFAVTITLLPFTILFFNQFSAVSLVANFIAMPVICFIVIPLSLFGALTLFASSFIGNWTLYIAIEILSLVWSWLELFSNISWSSWHHSIYNFWLLLAALIAVLLFLAPQGLPARHIGLLYLFPLVFCTPAKPKEGDFWVTVLDVGQGLATIVQTANRTLIYDSGPKFFDQDAGLTTVIPYLRSRLIRNIDKMIISHGDADHSGGAKSILATLPVNSVLTSDKARLFPYKSHRCFSGESWHWDGVDFQILSPPKNSNLTGNNASCVLRISSGENSILLPGDIENDAENKLVKKHKNILKSDVLLVPHHGSKTSSDRLFVDKVNPKYAVFSTGYRNRFRFPHKDVLKKYKEGGAIILNTPLTGAITFKFIGKSGILSADLNREKMRRFWNN